MEINIGLFYGVNDYNTIKVVFDKELTETEIKAFKDNFKGVYFNDLSGEYWCFDIPLENKDLVFTSYDTEKQVINFKVVYKEDKERKEQVKTIVNFINNTSGILTDIGQLLYIYDIVKGTMLDLYEIEQKFTENDLETINNFTENDLGEELYYFILAHN